jgi:hypothetical protein
MTETFYQQRQWLDSAGRGIFSRTPYREDGAIAGDTLYFGQGSLTFAGGPQPLVVPFEFAIPGASVAEAFANSQAAYEAGRDRTEADVRRKMEEAQRQSERQLVLPNGQMIPKSNGHPRTGR